MVHVHYETQYAEIDASQIDQTVNRNWRHRPELRVAERILFLKTHRSADATRKRKVSEPGKDDPWIG